MGIQVFSVLVEFKRNLLDMHFRYIKYSVQIGTMYENTRTCQLCAVSKDELSVYGILDFIILSHGAFPKKLQVKNQEHSNEMILKGVKSVSIDRVDFTLPLNCDKVIIFKNENTVHNTF